MSANKERSAWRRCAIPIALIVSLPVLAACEQINAGQSAGFSSAGAVSVQLAQSAGTQPTQVAISPQLEPAPEIFEATGRALWDGKRTLQGVWVAHPLAASARRVRIFNIDTGAAADGALFKRDAALQGAPVLISSEAAELLGMTPGVEARLRIVAVSPVKTRAAEAKPSEQEPDDQTDEPVKSQAAAAQTEAPKPEPAETESTKAEETKPEEAQSEDVQPTQAKPEDAQPAEAQAAEQPEPEKTEEPQVAAVSPEPSPKPQPKPKAEAQPKTEPAAKTEPKPKAEPKSVAPEDEDVEPERPEHKDRVFKFEEPPQTEPDAKSEPEIKTAAKPETQASPLRQPFIQAGTFGVPDNAKRLVRRLKNKGIPAQRKSFTTGGKTWNRVLAGPFNTTSARNKAQATIRAMGLKDAIPVRR